ncbi:uncharacterized protein LOC116274116 isoform X2 [Papio anubis]|uniref:uncharacterized protein LOC116274116 isoform X2 n=1 Tax=Papio anubis TaxID=9555 RepID=UPI0012AE8CE7|nr:uncharacterized protein LOC116274116 isoform X2 [Papio anubis]
MGAARERKDLPLPPLPATRFIIKVRCQHNLTGKAEPAKGEEGFYTRAAQNLTGVYWQELDTEPSYENNSPSSRTQLSPDRRLIEKCKLAHCDFSVPQKALFSTQHKHHPIKSPASLQSAPLLLTCLLLS